MWEIKLIQEDSSLFYFFILQYCIGFPIHPVYFLSELAKGLSSRTITMERASLVTQMVKNPPAMWETWVQSLSWEDPLEKGMATNSSILAWRIQWTKEPGGYSPWGHKKWNTTE